jgi:enoyl-CoA hydratase/carnithine racemase
LPRLIGPQKAALLFYTSRRIGADQALAWGLVDEVVPGQGLRGAAFALAEEMAAGAPLALQSTRKTLRANLAQAVRLQTDHEYAEQQSLARTADHAEGIRAVAERRPGRFQGR